MHIIDEVQEAIKHMQAISNHPLSRTELDPVVSTSGEVDVWTLGMVVPMRVGIQKSPTMHVSAVFRFWLPKILAHYHDACAIGWSYHVDTARIAGALRKNTHTRNLISYTYESDIL
jgi:hypothetical protein